jgi:hypothetical protein
MTIMSIDDRGGGAAGAEGPEGWGPRSLRYSGDGRRSSRSRRFKAVMRSFICSDRRDARVGRLGNGRGPPGVRVVWQYTQPCFKPCLHSLIDSRLLALSILDLALDRRWWVDR